MPSPHRGSHVEILSGIGAGPGRGIDAVVVPAGRSVDHLATAAHIAAKVGGTLLALCDRDARAADVGDVAEKHGSPRWVAVDAPAGCLADRVPLPQTPAHLPELGGRTSLSQKRNLGLLVARMVGWRTVLFLDDDIRDLEPGDLAYATAGLRESAAVGFPVTDWPDNSVVCHANRISGGGQNVFVGGSALLVDTTSDLLSYFPTIYNEDWLFLFDALLRRRVGRAPSRVAQLPYDPFRDLKRGRDEEFGEIIAEGLVHFAHDPTRALPPNHEKFWREFLQRRRTFLAGVIERLEQAPPDLRRRTALNAVRIADQQRGTVTAAQCVRFVNAWRRERGAFLAFQRQLPSSSSVRDALSRFGLEPVAPTPRKVRRYEIGPVAVGTAPPRRLEVIERLSRHARTLAVVVPGFLDSGSAPGADSLITTLSRNDWSAVTFDPRGTWRSGTDLEQLKPSVQVRDTLEVIRKRLPYERVALAGHSLGAYIALLAAAQEPSVTDVVAIMPPRCFVWPGDYDESQDSWRTRGVKQFWISPSAASARWRFRVPHSVVRDAVDHDLPGTLSRLHRRRVLFVAGQFDEVIPVAAVKRLYDECGCEDKHLVVLPVGHDYRDRADHRRVVNDLVASFLNGATTPQAASGTRITAPAPVPAGRS